MITAVLIFISLIAAIVFMVYTAEPPRRKR
jgi:hypothetical protein